MNAAAGVAAVIAVGFMVWAEAAAACAIALQGQAVQGGLVIGRAPAGQPVTIDGRPVRVSPDGLFVAGFGRDAPALATITAGTVVCALAIENRSYKITRINGLPSGKVTPKVADLKRIKADNAAIGRVRRLDTAATD